MSDEVHEQQARVWARQRREAGMAEDAIREELSRRGFGDPWIDAVMAEPLPERVEAGPERAAAKGCAGGVALWIVLTVGCLAVVLAAGAIAVAVTAPVFFRAREKATATSCMSNLKQLQLGQLMYVQDWNEVFPDAKTWPDVQLPYIHNQQVYLCPEDPSPAMPGAFPVSYGMNVGLSRRQLKTVARPAETPSLYDAATIYGDETVAVFRHNDGLNVAFSDGHAKWIARGSWGTVWSAGVSSLAPAASAPTNSGGAP